MTEIKSNADIEPCLSVVMPVYNEAATVAEVIKVVLAQRPVQQLVIVDDASTDGTWDKPAGGHERRRAGDPGPARGKPGQRRGVAHGIRPGDRAHRHHPGRRFGI